jgi:RibD domain-containing protein
MGKVLWHTMMSLDGFIAGPNHDMSWVFGVDGGSGETAEAVVGSTGALLVGRRTQDIEDRRWHDGAPILGPVMRAEGLEPPRLVATRT